MESPKRKRDSAFILLLLSIPIFLLWLIAEPFVNRAIPFPVITEQNRAQVEAESLHWQRKGQFGDLFGAVNALFSALALIGALYAVSMQRDASKEQQVEITKQQETQARIAEEMKRQAEIMKAELDLLRTQQAAADERLRLASLPAFIFVPKQGRDRAFTYKVENAGAPVREISISPQETIGAHFSPHERLFWKTDKVIEVDFFVRSGEQIPPNLNITVKCRTLRGEDVTELYRAEWGKPAERVGSFS